MKNKSITLKVIIIVLFSYLLLTSQAHDRMAQQKAELIRLLEQKYSITDRNIIRALQTADRGDFIPEDLKGFAYIDISLPIDSANVMLSYSDLVKVITSIPQGARRGNVLVIGRNSAFSAATLSFLYNRVFLIESNIASRNRVEVILREKYSNINFVFTDDFTHFNANAPFDLIFINGSINEFSRSYIDLLNQNGIVIFALSDRYGLGTLHKATRTGPTYSITSLGEVMFPALN